MSHFFQNREQGMYWIIQNGGGFSAVFPFINDNKVGDS